MKLGRLPLIPTHIPPKELRNGSERDTGCGESYWQGFFVCICLWAWSSDRRTQKAARASRHQCKRYANPLLYRLQFQCNCRSAPELLWFRRPQTSVSLSDLAGGFLQEVMKHCHLSGWRTEKSILYRRVWYITCPPLLGELLTQYWVLSRVFTDKSSNRLNLHKMPRPSEWKIHTRAIGKRT